MHYADWVQVLAGGRLVLGVEVGMIEKVS